MIKSKKLSKFKQINHGFFDKKGGKSTGIYKSLNCGIGSSDSKKNVLKNLKIVCKKINCSYKNLILLNQVHSNKFHFINKNYNNIDEWWNSKKVQFSVKKFVNKFARSNNNPYTFLEKLKRYI